MSGRELREGGSHRRNRRREAERRLGEGSSCIGRKMARQAGKYGSAGRREGGPGIGLKAGRKE